MEDHCNQLKDLLKDPEPGHENETPNLKPQINWLKEKVSTPKEYGVEIKKTMSENDNFIYTPNRVESQNQTNVTLKTGTYFVIWLHSHPTGTYGMFSFGDLMFLRKAYNAALDSRKTEITIIIVGKDPVNSSIINTYAIKIDDFALFDAEIEAFCSSPGLAAISDDLDMIDAAHVEQSKKFKASQGNIEKSFLEQFAGFGISLYKATPNLASWNKLELLTNPTSPTQSTVQTNPCN